MCIIIAKPAKERIPKERLENAFKNNPDGFGLAFPNEKKTRINIVKGFTFEEFYSKYLEVENRSCLIHFRIKTHGDIHISNNHPFRINNSLVMAHNGQIKFIEPYMSKDSIDSDTKVFRNKVLKVMSELDPYFYMLPYYLGKIKNMIDSSKMVFMDATGEFYIINQTAGHFILDVWYSNYNYYAKTTYQNWNNQRECPTCNKTKSLFYRNELKKSVCDDCWEILEKTKKKWNKKNKSKNTYRSGKEQKFCPTCKQWDDSDKFNFDPNHKMCDDCFIEMSYVGY